MSPLNKSWKKINAVLEDTIQALTDKKKNNKGNIKRKLQLQISE